MARAGDRDNGGRRAGGTGGTGCPRGARLCRPCSDDVVGGFRARPSGRGGGGPGGTGRAGRRVRRVRRPTHHGSTRCRWSAATTATTSRRRSPRSPTCARLIDPAGQRRSSTRTPRCPSSSPTRRVRQIELDVFADPNGGLYANPLIRWAADRRARRPGDERARHQGAARPGRRLPQHLPHARRLPAAGQGAGRTRNRGHVPIAILSSSRTSRSTSPASPFVVPLTVDRRAARRARRRDPQRVPRAPDVSRRTTSAARTPTLEDAVLTTGWPTLGESRGKVMFLMDNGGDYRTDYLAGHPSLRGPGDVHDARRRASPTPRSSRRTTRPAQPGADQRRWSRRGYVVRTRADADTSRRAPATRRCGRRAGQRRPVGEHRLPRARDVRAVRDDVRRPAPRRRDGRGATR